MREQIQMQCINQVQKNPNCSDYLERQRLRVKEIDAFQKSMVDLEQMEKRINGYVKAEEIRKYAQESIQIMKSCRKYIKVPSIKVVDGPVLVQFQESIYTINNLITCELSESDSSLSYVIDDGFSLLKVNRIVELCDNSISYAITLFFSNIFGEVRNNPRVFVEENYEQFLNIMANTGLKMLKPSIDNKNSKILLDEPINMAMLTSYKEHNVLTTKFVLPSLIHLDHCYDRLDFRDGSRIDISKYQIIVDVDAISQCNICLPPFVFRDVLYHKSVSLKSLQVGDFKSLSDSYLSSFCPDFVLRRSYLVEICFITNENRFHVLTFLQGYYIVCSDLEFRSPDGKYYANLFFLEGTLFICVSVEKFHCVLDAGRKLASGYKYEILNKLGKNRHCEFTEFLETNIRCENWLAENNPVSPLSNFPVFKCTRLKERVLSLLEFDDNKMEIHLGYAYVYCGFEYSLDDTFLKSRIFSVAPYNLYSRLYIDRSLYRCRTNISYNFCDDHDARGCLCNMSMAPEKLFVRGHRTDVHTILRRASRMDSNKTVFFFFRGRGSPSRSFKLFNTGLHSMSRRKLRYHIRGKNKNVKVDIKII